MIDDASNRHISSKDSQPLYKTSSSLKQFDENILDTEEIKDYIEQPSKAH